MKHKSLLIAALLMAFASVSMAQVTLTQTTTNEFQRGTGQNVIIANDQVSLQSIMTGINNFDGTTNLPQTLMNHELATWQTYVFCVGGYNGTEAINNVYRATQQTSGISSWTTMNSLPVGLTHAAVVASQQNLIVMGGKNEEGVSNKIYYAYIDPLNGNLGEWNEASLQLPQPLWGAKAIAVHDNIYLIGGANTDDETAASSKVYCLRLNARGTVASITEVSNLPAARNGHAVASYDSKIYVIGGHDATGDLKNTVYRASVNLNGSLSSWAAQTALPVAISSHSAVCTNGFLAVIGGMTTDLPSNQIYYTYMDNSNLSWTTSTAVLSVRTHSGASCAFGDKMFYSGGQVLSGSIVNYMRYAPVVTGDSKVKKSCYVSKPFDIGNPMKNVQDLNFTLTHSSTTSYEILYRIADANSNFGNWISGGSNGLVTINQTCSAIQYMLRMTATGSDDLAIEEAQAIITGYTQLAGNLDNLSTISAGSSPYIVTGDISFTTGIHNVEAGVEIYFQENTGLTIYGACVNFNGTEEHPILLTYANADQKRWKGVFFDGGPWPYYSGMYDNNASTWNYTTLSNAGYGDNQANLYLYRAHQPIFTSCNFVGSLQNGIRMIECDGTTFADCIITDNENNALDITSSTPLMTSCVMTNSDYAIYFRNNYFPNFTNCAAYNNNFGIYSCTPDRSFVYDASTLALYDNDIEIRMPGGRIYDSRTWNYYDNGYWIEGTLEINDGDRPTLTIAPGNTILMNPNTEIRLYGGGILAVGTVTDSITFTPKNGAVGGWYGFRFYDGSDDNAASSLRYCVIEKATSNIYSEYTTQPSLMYSTVRQGVNYNLDITRNSSIDIDGIVSRDCPIGLNVWNNSSANLVASSFDNCSNCCVRVDGNNNHAEFYYCTMNNSNIGVRYSNPDLNIPNYAVNNSITFNNVTSPVGLDEGRILNRSWGANEYGIFGDLYVYSDWDAYDTAQLTLEAGSTLRFAQGKHLRISHWSSGWAYKGKLSAVGTEETPIVFTSLNGEIGGWEGLRFYEGAQTSLLKHCVFEKGNDYNVYVENTRKTHFEDCAFHNSNNYGMRFNSPDYIHGENMVNLSFNNNQYDGIAINGGILYGQRIWNDYDYFILGDIDVRGENSNDTAILTLSPGATLRFSSRMWLQVGVSERYGRLIAEGTEENPITFTSLNGETGGWFGLRFYGYTSPSSLKHCIFEKGDSYNVYVENTHNTRFEDCAFNNSNNYGMRFNSPEYIHGENMVNLSFNGNQYDGIAINGGTLYGQRTWGGYDYYVTDDHFWIRAENTSDIARLTLCPGATLHFAPGRYMQVSWNDYYGSLIAEGTEEAPITFTSTNGAIGGWNCLAFYSYTAPSSLKHCIFEKGSTHNVYVNNTSNVLFENCEFRLAADRGASFVNYASPTVRLCSFHHNTLCGVYLSDNATPILGGSPENANDILFNNNWAIYQDGGNDIDMSYNFYGTMDSLFIESSIYDRIDNGWRGRVNAFPVSMLPVAGHTLTGTLLYDGNPDYTMPGSTVMVKNFDDEVLYQTTTDATGHFAIENMTGGARKVDFIPNVDVEGTITTADALAVMLHYVHETMLSGHRLTIADVNGSGTVNGTDALFIQKRYVHQIETMPVGDMYYSLYDSLNYGLYATDLTMTALAYGDVNASYQVLRDGINLLSDGQVLVGPNQYYDIPVSVLNAIEAGAISLKLNYPAEYLSVERVLLPNGEEAMIYDNEGQVTISWYSLDPMLLSNNDLMLTLGIRTKDIFNLNEPITFSLDNRSELTDGSAQVLSNVTLTMPELITLGYEGLDENDIFGLSVYPNPMGDRSLVRYNLPTEGRVTFCIYDLLGNTVQAVELGVQSLGQHEIELSGLASGIYMGRLAISGNREDVQIVKIVVK